MKFIIKSCHQLMTSYYTDGREIYQECGDSTEDKKCYDVEDCFLKKIAENLLKVVNSGVCNRCDGCGYDEGCMDSSCGTYNAYKCLDLLDVEFVDEDKE